MVTIASVDVREVIFVCKVVSEVVGATELLIWVFVILAVDDDGNDVDDNTFSNFLDELILLAAVEVTVDTIDGGIVDGVTVYLRMEKSGVVLRKVERVCSVAVKGTTFV